MKQSEPTSLHQRLIDKRELRDLCAQAVHQQIARGDAQASQLRNRKRYLAKQVHC